MRMVLIDERTLDARVVDIDLKKESEFLQELMPGMRMPAVMTRVISGIECSIMHDDEYLYQTYNVTGMCEDAEEILMGSLIIAAIKEWNPEDEDDDDWGLRDLTEEEAERIVGSWRPVEPELAERYAADVHPSLLYMMGSNVLHYKVE